MVADRTSTPRRTAPTASTEDAPRTGRRRLARALTAAAASGEIGRASWRERVLS